MANDGAITVSVMRTVKAGFEPLFEKALHDFVQRSLELPGEHGVHILRPAPGSASREYGIVRKFADREALETFHASAAYRDWLEVVDNYTEGGPRSEELSGLESWFTLPGTPMRTFPKWKMAIATFLGVFPVATFLGLTIAPQIASLPLLVKNAVFNACVVAMLTWIVMPVITRTLHGWLIRK